MKPVLPAFAIAMLAALATPALAGHSTPQEREVTRQLNLEAARQAQATNQESAATSAVRAQNQAPPSAAPTSPIETAPVPDQNQNASPAGNASPDASPPAQ